MTGTRLLVPLLVLGLAAPPARGDGPFGRKARPDAARVRQLAEVLRSDPDEKACRSAVAELTGADPRANPDVIPALLAGLRREAAGVRAAAADAIGRFKTVFPVAGNALEAAAETDPAPAVRDAARRSLWEYHLNGYRSPRGWDGFAAQTAEPPLAKPGRPRAPAPPAVVPTGASAPAPPPAAPPLPPGPRAALLPGLHGPRTILSPVPPVPPPPDPAAEPPVARRPGPWVDPSFPSPEPPFARRWVEPAAVGRPPPIALDLPPIVPHPGVIPGTAPLPEPTAEPPVRRP